MSDWSYVVKSTSEMTDSADNLRRINMIEDIIEDITRVTDFNED